MHESWMIMWSRSRNHAYVATQHLSSAQHILSPTNVFQNEYICHRFFGSLAKPPSWWFKHQQGIAATTTSQRQRVPIRPKTMNLIWQASSTIDGNRAFAQIQKSFQSNRRTSVLMVFGVRRVPRQWTSQDDIDQRAITMYATIHAAIQSSLNNPERIAHIIQGLANKGMFHGDTMMQHVVLRALLPAIKEPQVIAEKALSSHLLDTSKSAQSRKRLVNSEYNDLGRPHEALQLLLWLFRQQLWQGNPLLWTIWWSNLIRVFVARCELDAARNVFEWFTRISKPMYASTFERCKESTLNAQRPFAEILDLPSSPSTPSSTTVASDNGSNLVTNDVLLGTRVSPTWSVVRSLIPTYGPHQASRMMLSQLQLSRAKSDNRRTRNFDPANVQIDQFLRCIRLREWMRLESRHVFAYARKRRLQSAQVLQDLWFRCDAVIPENTIRSTTSTSRNQTNTYQPHPWCIGLAETVPLSDSGYATIAQTHLDYSDHMRWVCARAMKHPDLIHSTNHANNLISNDQVDDENLSDANYQKSNNFAEQENYARNGLSTLYALISTLAYACEPDLLRKAGLLLIRWVEDTCACDAGGAFRPPQKWQTKLCSDTVDEVEPSISSTEIDNDSWSYGSSDSDTIVEERSKRPRHALIVQVLSECAAQREFELGISVLEALFSVSQDPKWATKENGQKQSFFAHALHCRLEQWSLRYIRLCCDQIQLEYDHILTHYVSSSESANDTNVDSETPPWISVKDLLSIAAHSLPIAPERLYMAAQEPELLEAELRDIWKKEKMKNKRI